MKRWLKNITGGAPFYPLLVLSLFNLFDVLDRTAFGVLTPNIQRAFKLNIRGITTLAGAVGIAVLVLGIPIAYYADRRSRVKIAVAGAAAWSAASVATGLAPNIGVMAASRAGSGLGVGVVTPTHTSLLADYYDPSVRTKVYSFHNGANAIGLCIGPLVAGLLAHSFGWRIPFIIFAFPTVVVIFMAARLRDPVRGRHERMAMGAEGETLDTEEIPPSFQESMRILWNVKTLKRIWISLPFLTAAFVGYATLISLYYDQVFHLNEAQRGYLAAGIEPAQIVGLFLGIPIATKMVQRDAGLLIKFLAVAGTLTAGSFVLLSVAPNLAWSIVANVIITGVNALLLPGVYAALSLAIPPKVRSLGFTLGQLFIAPGLIALPIIGSLSDHYGIRKGLLFIVPIVLLGSGIIASSGSLIKGDINRVWTSAMAQASVLYDRRHGKSKLLLVKSVDVAYDRVQVLFGVDFEVDEGEIVALLGTNGAGKSTLLKAISGLVEADAGAIVFDGRDMTYAPPNEVVARGVVQVPGGKGVFPTLTVAENLRIAGWLFRRDSDYMAEAVERVLEIFPVLRERWDQPAGNLSGGEQQMLTLSQAFIAKPRLLMIDELSLGLAPIIVEQLLNIVKEIQARGTTIILVEQSVNVALSIAHTAYFMEKGEIRFHGPTAELLQRPDILRSVFLEGAAAVTGVSATASTNGRAASNGHVVDRSARVLEVRGLTKRFGGIMAVDDVTFSLHRGQILGIIGPNGAGKTTIFDLISGFLASDGGSIVLLDHDITELAPDARARRGLGRSFQDARLFPALTVGEALALSLEGTVAVKDPLATALRLPSVVDSEAAVRARVDELIDFMGLSAFRDKFVSELSTGSRRIVDLACIVAHKPSVLLLDEPSSGIAQRETEALGPLLLRIREATGASLLVIEHDMPLITGIADSILAMDLGHVVMEGTPHEVVNDPRVVASYLGSTEEVIARSGATGASLVT